MTSAPARSQLRALTGLRFVAAFQVLVFHCVPWGTWAMPAAVRNVAGSGFVAVSFFFVLSGFILTYAHGARPQATSRFYVNRFARVYPAYAFALALVAPFYFVHTIRTEGVAKLASEAIPVAALMQAWLPGAAMAWNPPGWSLSTEALFYAVFPFVAPAVMAMRRGTAAAIGVASYALCLAAPLAYMHFMPDGPIPIRHESMAFWLNLVRYAPALHLGEFVLGIVVARFYLDRQQVGGDGSSRLSSITSVILSLALVAILANADAVPYLVLHNGVLAPLFALLIVSLAAGEGPVAALLSTRPMVALGDASYSLYLLQVPLLIYWGKLDGHLPASLRSGVLSHVALVLGAVGASLLCHRYIELPMRDRVLKWWSARVARLGASANP